MFTEFMLFAAVLTHSHQYVTFKTFLPVTFLTAVPSSLVIFVQQTFRTPSTCPSCEAFQVWKVACFSRSFLV
jgi:hypothetical protein